MNFFIEVFGRSYGISFYYREARAVAMRAICKWVDGTVYPTDQKFLSTQSGHVALSGRMIAVADPAVLLSLMVNDEIAGSRNENSTYE